MAIDSNALTLSEWAHLSNDPLVMKITDSMLKTNNLLQDIPLVTDGAMKMVGMRTIDNLPVISWGQINKAPTVTKGKPTPYEEQAFLVRNQFQVDKRLQNNKNNITPPLQYEVDSFMEAFNYEFNFRYIQNDPSNPNDLTGGTNTAWEGMPDSIVGLRTRLNNPTEYGVNSEMYIDASTFYGGIDLTAATLGGSSGQQAANNFIALVQNMLNIMGAPNGDGVIFYGNDFLKLQWEYAIRVMGIGAGFDVTRDNFDHPVEKYKAATIRDVGRMAPQAGGVQTTRVITSYEKANGQPGTFQTDLYTSLYAVRYGTGFFRGWQTNKLVPENLGIDPTNGMMINMVVDWGMGLLMEHTRSICGAHGIKINVSGSGAHY